MKKQLSLPFSVPSAWLALGVAEEDLVSQQLLETKGVKFVQGLSPRSMRLMSELENVKIVSLWQPWASFVAWNLKQLETRTWQTSYAGKLAIHAAKRPIDAEGYKVIERVSQLLSELSPEIKQPESYPLQAIVAVADLAYCRRMDEGLIAAQSPLELAVGDWQPGRYAWSLRNTIALDPIHCQGVQRIARVKDPVILQAIVDGVLAA